MPEFKYYARDKLAKGHTGVLEAENKSAAAKKLQDMGYIPISIVAVTNFSGIFDFFEKFRRVSLEEVSVFTRQLYSLQKTGLPLLTGLDAIAKQSPNKLFKAVINQISADVRGGLSFSASLKKHDKVFDEIYLSMIKAGEASGSLVVMLENLSELIEKEIDTRSRVKAATRYPVLAFGVLCVGFIVLVLFVIPRFAVIYSSFQVALPLPTRILIGTYVAIKKFWFLFILFIGIAVFGFNRFLNSVSGRRIWDTFNLKIIVFGPLITMLIMSRFARVTAILLKSGVPILETLDIVAHTSGNVVISSIIRNIKESVNQGKGISGTMSESGFFPPIVVQMIAIGEQTGKIDELLFGVADYYDRESNYMIKNLSTYIEPLLIFILAGMVLTMALAIFLPMWNLIKVFH